jgi:hypothetical protein
LHISYLDMLDINSSIHMIMYHVCIPCDIFYDQGQELRHLLICLESAYQNSGSIQIRYVHRYQTQTFLLHNFTYFVIFCRNSLF